MSGTLRALAEIAPSAAITPRWADEQKPGRSEESPRQPAPRIQRGGSGSPAGTYPGPWEGDASAAIPQPRQVTPGEPGQAWDLPSRGHGESAGNNSNSANSIPGGEPDNDGAFGRMRRRRRSRSTSRPTNLAVVNQQVLSPAPGSRRRRATKGLSGPSLSRLNADSWSLVRPESHEPGTSERPASASLRRGGCLVPRPDVRLSASLRGSGGRGEAGQHGSIQLHQDRNP